MAVERSLLDGLHGRADFAAVEADKGCFIPEGDRADGQFITAQLFNKPVGHIQG